MTDNEGNEKKPPTQLKLVKTDTPPTEGSSFVFDLRDIESVNLEKLRDMRLKAGYALSAYNFREAGIEFAHLDSLRQMVTEFEKELSDPATKAKMSIRQKIDTAKALFDHYHKSRAFVGDLSKEMNSGNDMLAALEKMKASQEQKPVEEKPSPQLEDVKKLVFQVLKEKVCK